MKTERKKIEETESQNLHQNTVGREIFDLDSDLQIHAAKELISQHAATLDFEDDGSGKPKSVTVKRSLDKSIIFYSEEERDIQKFIN